MGAPDESVHENEYKLQESSSEHDASLMQGLPASMKKLVQLSVDRSRTSMRQSKQSVTQSGFEQPQPDQIPDTESSDVDFDLKFMSKKALMLGESLPKLSKIKKPSPYNSRDHSPYTKYHRNLELRSPPQHHSPKKIIDEPQKYPVRGYEPSEYLADEFQAHQMRESLGHSIVQDSEFINLHF
jgi:hypothetical protein